MSALYTIVSLAAAISTSTSTPQKPAPPTVLKVLIAPSISGEQEPREPELENKFLGAFSSAFTDAAIEVFTWRHFFVVAGNDAEDAIERIAKGGTCRTVLCTRDVAYGIGATHALFSRMTKQKDGTCAVFVSLYDLLRGKEDVREKRDIKPCTADNVLSTALELGRRVAEGPRAPVAVTLDLTKRQIRPIDVPDIEDISIYGVTTSTVPRKRRGFVLERALDIYKEKYMFTFEDESHPGGLYVARNNRLISECEVRRAASAPLPREIREFCDGNDWELAWFGVPAGVLISALSAGASDSGGGVLGFILGIAISGTSAALALVLDVDRVDLEEGLHYSDRDALESIVAKSNQTLREVLDLTPAEVKVAGMRE